MSDQFNDKIQGTIERCRRIASITHDKKVAAELLELAAQLQATLPGEPIIGAPDEEGGQAAND